MNNTLSIVIRTMPGRERFLDKCLFILSGQDYSDVEVVIVAQKLTEESATTELEATAEQWRDHFPSMRVLTHISETDARARSLNIGKRAAGGRYLAFLDDDDKVYPNHYSRLIESLRESDYAWGYADIVRALYNEYGQLVSRSAPFRRDGYSYLDHLRGNFIPIHSFVIDTGRAIGIGDVDESMSRNEDYEFILRLAFKHEPLYVPGFGAEYCIRSDGSNTVSDGTGDAIKAARKRRLWNTAQDILEEKKLGNLGWWVRELEKLPAVFPHQPHQAEMHYAAERVDLRHTTRNGASESSYRRQLKDYYGSTSWRLTSSARNFVRRVRQQPPFISEVPPTEEEALRQIQVLLRSTSWELTAPLRLAKKIVNLRKTA